MDERLKNPELNNELKQETKRNVFRETLASLGYMLVGNPNVDYRAIVDHTCDKVRGWGLFKIRDINSNIKD